LGNYDKYLSPRTEEIYKMTTSKPRVWLIRDLTNSISGPIAREDILQQLKSLKIRGKMEISAANTYWFAVDEKQELFKFFPELGDSGPTEIGIAQHTATMTKSELPSASQLQAMENAAADQTSIISGFSAKPTESSAAGPEQSVGEWLSPEYAEEFGLEMMDDGAQSIPASADDFSTIPQEESNAPMPSIEQLVRSPSPRTFHEDPTLSDIPINPNKAPSYSKYNESTEEKSNHGRKILLIVAALVMVIAALAAIVFFVEQNRVRPVVTQKARVEKTEPGMKFASEQEKITAGLLMSDSKLLQASLMNLEEESRNNPLAPLTAALIKGSFNFDTEGAIAALESAKNFAETKPELVAEIENLFGVYSASSSALIAKEHFKNALLKKPNDLTFKYNLLLSDYLIAPTVALNQSLAELIKQAEGKRSVQYEALLIQGQIALDFAGGAAGDAEFIFRKARDIMPNAARATLLLATSRLLKRGLGDSKENFREFLRMMTDLDPLERVPNYRIAKSDKLYTKVLELIRNNQSVTKNSNTSLDPLIMAVDGMLTALKNEYLEADKTLDHALRLAPGDPDVILVKTYLKYREEKFEDVVDLLKDKTKEVKDNFPFLKILGLAYIRLDKLSLAEQVLVNASKVSPEQSEIYSLLGDVVSRGANPLEATKYYKTALSKNMYDGRAVSGLIRLGNRELLQREIYKELLPL
jgi:tetratricopeptide (TPR) repeat protein